MCGDAEKVLELTARTVVNAARFYSGAASRAEDSCTAEPYRSSDGMREGACFAANDASCTRVLRIRAGELSTLLVAAAALVVVAVCSHAGSCHSSCAQHFVCISAPLLHIRPALWRRVSLRTTAPTPPQGAQSRPFARILSRSLCKQHREGEQEKSLFMANGNANLASVHTHPLSIASGTT